MQQQEVLSAAHAKEIFLTTVNVSAVSVLVASEMQVRHSKSMIVMSEGEHAAA